MTLEGKIYLHSIAIFSKIGLISVFMKCDVEFWFFFDNFWPIFWSEILKSFKFRLKFESLQNHQSKQVSKIQIFKAFPYLYSVTPFQKAIFRHILIKSSKKYFKI